MPYIKKDKDGNIIKISNRILLDGEAVPHNNPGVVAFLRQRGKDPNQIQEALDVLRKTDAEMVRAIEDIIMLLLRKNIVKMNELPPEVQDRLNLRNKSRMIMNDIYDQASARVL